MNKAIKEYFSAMGRKGGSVISDKKKDAARANGKKGGRPKKVVSTSK